MSKTIFGKNQIEPIVWKKYEGEEIIFRTIIRDGKKIFEKKFHEDRVKAKPKGNAYIIGNGPSRQNFDLSTLKASGQTYGCNAIYRDFIPDFIFSVDTQMTETMCKDNVMKKTIHYAPSLHVNRPYAENLLHLIPWNTHTISGNQAISTACVHGHKNLYLIGFDFREYGQGQMNNMYQDTDHYGERHSDTIFEGWLKWFRDYLKMRPYCNFTIVHNNPPEYLNHLQTGTDLKNSKIISYKEFSDVILNQHQ
jgi:hypothetical protein|tara:strand:- start:137 stop:889 length:753 start_codon:yes stop_codon:yes gene_type:complete